MMSTLVLSRPSEKHCRGCGRLLPLGRFRRYRAGQDWPRHHDCNDCRNRQDRDQRHRQRLRRTLESLSQLAAERNIERMGAAVHALLSACGGMDRFVADLAALMRSRGPVIQSRIFQALVALDTARDQAQARVEERRRRDSVALEEASQDHVL
ncbi:MAG: hypothetical protein AB7Q45_08250, partial [Planctomycetaceae bacterium]